MRTELVFTLGIIHYIYSDYTMVIPWRDGPLSCVSPISNRQPGKKFRCDIFCKCIAWFNLYATKEEHA